MKKRVPLLTGNPPDYTPPVICFHCGYRGNGGYQLSKHQSWTHCGGIGAGNPRRTFASSSVSFVECKECGLRDIPSMKLDDHKDKGGCQAYKDRNKVCNKKRLVCVVA